MTSLTQLSDLNFYIQFQEFLKEKYPDVTFSEKDIKDKFENIFMMGLRQAQTLLDDKKPHDILFDGKTPRADMMRNLGNILWELQKITSFPIIPPLKITAALKKILGSRDHRTQKVYLDWIIQYSHNKRESNSANLTNLIENFPQDLIIAAT